MFSFSCIFSFSTIEMSGRGQQDFISFVLVDILSTNKNW